MRFGRIITNIGDGYVQDDGRFIAPINGTYQFSANLQPQSGSVLGRLMQNDEAVVVTHNGGSGAASLSVILELKKGDGVYLVSVDSNVARFICWLHIRRIR